MRQMNNADLIVATLKAAGIGRGFGVPSGNVLPLMEAMRVGGIDFMLTAHEGSAGFAADVTARMTGTPGLCIATLGPGATNLATGVGCAYLDRSPLIAITCTLNEAQLGRRIQMWIDHEALFKPITKASFRLRPGHIAATRGRSVANRDDRAAGSGPSRFAGGRGPCPMLRKPATARTQNRAMNGRAPLRMRSKPPLDCSAAPVARSPSSARARCACGALTHCGRSWNATASRSRRPRWRKA